MSVHTALSLEVIRTQDFCSVRAEIPTNVSALLPMIELGVRRA